MGLMENWDTKPTVVWVFIYVMVHTVYKRRIEQRNQ